MLRPFAVVDLPCGAMLFGALILCQGLPWASSAVAAPPPPKRAAPPTWTDEVRRTFFEDAREQLIGERSEAPATPVAGNAAALRSDAAVPASANWSDLVDEETLTSEVKRIDGRLRTPLSNASTFKAGGYRDCQREFSLLAVWMDVIGEHPDRIRWHDQATVLGDRFTRAANACATKDDAGHAAALEAKADLEEIIRGGRLPGPASGDGLSPAPAPDRTWLMQRMETGLEGTISPALSTRATLKRQQGEIRREAQLLAALAQVMQREPYEYWDDSDFVAMAHRLRDAAASLAQAAAENDLDAAQRAVGQAVKSCSDCHEGYRG